MQKKILRTIYKRKRFESVTQKFEETRILTAFELFVYELFKYIVQLITTNEQSWFSTLREHNQNTRVTRSTHNNLITKPRVHVSKFENFLQHRGAVLYNTLTSSGVLPKNLNFLNSNERFRLCKNFRNNILPGNIEFIDLMIR